jgi:hypothetical protein
MSDLLEQEHLEQRTWELRIPCTCSLPHFCPRFHGLPYPVSEFMELVGLNERKNGRWMFIGPNSNRKLIWLTEGELLPSED